MARGRAGFDYLIVGAGFAGSVLAERLSAAAGKKVLLIDRRPHVGGNAYDEHDGHGVLIHRYGPHIFNTNAPRIAEYLSRFTEWRPYEHRVLAHVDGMLVPIPINLTTINKLYGLNLTSDRVEAFLAVRAESVAEIRTSEDVVVSRVGRELYGKFFRGYLATYRYYNMDQVVGQARTLFRLGGTARRPGNAARLRGRGPGTRPVRRPEPSGLESGNPMPDTLGEE